MYRIHPVFISAFLFLCLLPQEFLLPVIAKLDPCDRDLQKRPDDPYGYCPRSENRCEGTYIKKRSGTISLISLTESFEEYDFNPKKNLVVEWKSFANVDMRLRAQGVRDELYYRMDALCQSEMQSYIWPLTILSGLKYPRRDIGILGWIQHSIGDAQEIYIPLSITAQDSDITSRFLFNMELTFQNDLNNSKYISKGLRQEFKKNGLSLPLKAAIKKKGEWWLIADIDKGYIVKKEGNKLGIYKARCYEVALLPGIELEEVYVSLAPVDNIGNQGDYAWKERQLGYGFYPQGWPVKFLIFDLLDLEKPGVYYLEIGIIPKYDAPFVMKFWFHHSSNLPSE